MNRKPIATVLLLTAMILSACGSQPPVEASTPSVDIPTVNTPTTEPPPPTSTTAPETTPTPERPRPTNPPDCTNSASFVSDVTIPDNTEIVGGTNFTKTWRVMNTGTCVWGPDYTLTHYSNERMGAPAVVPLGITYQGQTLDISVELTAPTSTGSHRGDFVIKNPAGLIMKINEDSRLWLIINVRTIATPTAAATATSPSGSGPGTCTITTDSTRVTDVFNAVNAYRTRSGKPAYRLNSRLAQAAQAHANDIACNQLFGHTGSDGSTVGSRVAAAGYSAAFVTENVYGSYPPLTAQEVVNWWINDKIEPRHNLNLISDTYAEIGVGYAFFNNYGYYVVVFAKP
jgi:uncharacterized protein YkwD